MKVLIYNELNPKTISGFAKLKKYLEEEDDDFKSAEVKKVWGQFVSGAVEPA